MWIYLAIINVVGLIFMLADKIKAMNGAWRIPETTLMGIAAIGGSLGTLIGIYLFRHKTLHPKFTVGVPVLLAIHAVLIVVLSSAF